MYISIHDVTEIVQKTNEMKHPSGKGTFRVTTLLVTGENGTEHEIKLFLKDDEDEDEE